MTFKSTLIALIIIIIWASNFMVIKTGGEAFEPLMLLATRFFIAGLIFLPFVKWPGLYKAAQIAFIGLLLGLLHQGTLYIGLQETSTSLMSIILQTNVIIITLMAWVILKEQIGWRTWAGIIIGIIGIIILVYKPGDTGTVQGITLGFISAAFVAFANFMMKQVDSVHAPTYMVFLHLPIAPLILLSSFFIEGTDWINNAPNLNWSVIAFAVLYQAIILSISHIYWQKLMVKYQISQLMPLTLMIPVFTMIMAVVILDEVITANIIIGGALTIAGIGFITLRKIQKGTM